MKNLFISQRDYKETYLLSQPQHAHISSYNSNLGTFIYNHVTGRDNLVSYIIQTEQPFTMNENPI